MTCNTLYKLSINGATTYFSTSSAEINAFASAFGMIGHAEEHGSVLYEIPTVVAQHPPGTFRFRTIGIKRQYLKATFKIITHAN